MIETVNEKDIGKTDDIITDNKPASETTINGSDILVPIKERIIYKITEKTEELYGKTDK